MMASGARSVRPRGKTVDTDLLPGGGPAWRLISAERSHIQREWQSATEEEACDAAWEMLKPRNKPLRTLSPEEWELGRTRTRQAIEDHRKAAENYRADDALDGQPG